MMSIYHCSIKIISRAGGRSAVASAAYRSGEKLYNDETGLTHNFLNKGGVIMIEIILPVNAPERYQDREVLWNEVQQIEKRSDAQFAREVEVALPIEMTRNEHIECVRSYIHENFVGKGMIADWALHDKGDGNPHAHIMLTMRGIDEHEQWLTKQKSVFANARDDVGRAIYNPELPSYDPKNKDATSKYRIPVLDSNGEQKKRVREGKGCEYLWEKISIPANDWNEHWQAEVWRKSWAEHCNKYLKEEQQIDHRSYERQGIDKEATVHEGVVARQLESEGKVADRCQINREVRERNSMREKAKELVKEITEMVTEKVRDIVERFKGFRAGLGDSASTRKYDGYLGGTRETDTSKGTRDSILEGTNRRIDDIKRAVEYSCEKAENTDRQIERTDTFIARIKELIVGKGAERDERIRKLKERRSATRDVGGDAGPDRKVATESDGGEREKIANAKSNIEALLRELNTEEGDLDEQGKSKYRGRGH